jgi:dethiobiotin synthetase
VKGVFVTGTDTGVGKTHCSCALIHALRVNGVQVAPMKPIAAGANPDGLNGDTCALLQAAGWEMCRAADVTPLLLREPIAPHIAARHQGVRIDLPPLLAGLRGLAPPAAFRIVEGVGGFRVPLDASHDTVDLARLMGLPLVMVVGMRLGCLNHALLTAQAIESAGLAMKGWIANTLDAAMPCLAENIEALAERLGAPLLGRIPYTAARDARGAARHLDVSPLLA